MSKLEDIKIGGERLEACIFEEVFRPLINMFSEYKRGDDKIDVDQANKRLFNLLRQAIKAYIEESLPKERNVAEYSRDEVEPYNQALTEMRDRLKEL